MLGKEIVLSLSLILALSVGGPEDGPAGPRAGVTGPDTATAGASTHGDSPAPPSTTDVDTSDGDASSADSASSTDDPFKDCTIEQVTLDPGVPMSNYDSTAAGKTSADGHLVRYSCGSDNPGLDGNQPRTFTYVYIPNGATVPDSPPLPPPDPADLALSASKTLTMPKPALHWGPLPDQVVVHYPLWLWADEPGPVETSVSLRGVTVTMAAKIDSITWHTGEPVSNPDGGVNTEAVVTCQGRGEPAPSVEQVAKIAVADRHPACGYAYQWRSTPERTHGTGSWTMRAEAQWTLTWTSNTGAGGTFTLHSENTGQIEVLELTTALVNGPESTDAGGG